jgi:signal transduction histidine kinase
MSLAPPSAPATDGDRARGLARLLASLADPPPPDQLGATVCQLACRHLAVDAAAFFVGDDRPEPLGAAGFAAAAPPAGVPASLSAADVARLENWAVDAGYRQLDLALVTLDARPAGLLALFSVAGPSLDAALLEILSLGLSGALAHARAARELVRAYEQQDREQDQRVRAERMRALGEMARGIAHDFNNVLNAILGQTGVLAALIGAEPAVGDALERLRKVALDGADTIRRVQEFSGQRRDRDFDRVDLGDVVRRAGDELRRRAPSNVRVEVRLGGRRVVRGNADELDELVRVLVDNALEAMPDGGTVGLELAPASDDVALLVADDGVGMPAGVKARALDPFFTTKGSRRKGLGLALAHGVARRHGGASLWW